MRVRILSVCGTFSYEASDWRSAIEAFFKSLGDNKKVLHEIDFLGEGMEAVILRFERSQFHCFGSLNEPHREMEQSASPENRIALEWIVETEGYFQLLRRRAPGERMRTLLTWGNRIPYLHFQVAGDGTLEVFGTGLPSTDEWLAARPAQR